MVHYVRQDFAILLKYVHDFTPLDRPFFKKKGMKNGSLHWNQAGIQMFLVGSFLWVFLTNMFSISKNEC